MLSTSIFAKDFKIEKDVVFKSLMTEFQDPGSSIRIYQESENYRFDLTLTDIIDRTTLVLRRKKFNKYKAQLDAIITQGNIYFLEWFKKLKELAQNDADFHKALDRKLYVQLYSKAGFALLPEYKVIDMQKIKDLGILGRIKRYNDLASMSEGTGIIAALDLVEKKPFITKALTVSKMQHVKRKTIRKVRKAYYKVYKDLVIRVTQSENNHLTERFKRLSYRVTKHGLKASILPMEDIYTKPIKNGVKAFNIIQTVSQKQQLLSFLDTKLKEDGISIPVHSGHLIATPIFLEENWEKVKAIFQEYTLSQIANVEDDEYLFLVRKWVKRNYESIQEKIVEYNTENQTDLSFVVKKAHKKPRRVEILKQYMVLEKLYPNRPWMRKNNPDLIDRKGRAKYFDASFGKRLGLRLGSLFRNLIKVENYTSLILGTTTAILSGGNFSLSLSVKSVVKNAVSTIKYDKEWKEFLMTAPAEVLNALLLGSGFSPGRLYKILALGSAQGALQSYMTGQDIKTGAYVGAGMRLLETYVLPYSIAKPMVKGFDSKALRTNRLLEIVATTVKNSAQGVAVSALTGENLLGGAWRGAAYGAISSVLTVWILGTRYHPFKDYDPQDVDDMIEAENAFQNDVGRGGLYEIDRQLILDSNYRVNGLWSDLVSSSIALPGNVTMTEKGFNRLTTLSHEASHLMQQHQSGVFGFYLFRYIPTYFRTGYKGHPDENFLKDFLDIYLP